MFKQKYNQYVVERRDEVKEFVNLVKDRDYRRALEYFQQKDKATQEVIKEKAKLWLKILSYSKM